MRRGEVWLVNLEPTLGAELRKTRPAVIVSSERVGVLPLRVIVPLTEWKERYAIAPWMVRVEPDANNGLDKPSAADCFQVRPVAAARLVRRLGRVSAEVMAALQRGLAAVLELE